MDNDALKRIEMLEKYVINHEEDIKNNAQRIEYDATALDLLHTSEENGRRMYKILIIVLIMWVLTLGGTIGGFLYYINTTTIEETTETAETSDGGNACVGDNCNNGEINYGEGDKEN